MLGDASVGKTCLANLFVKRKVEPKTQNTVGFDHFIKDMIVDGVPLKLQLWDTAGMEQFRNALISQYYRHTDGVILVYDITRRVTLENIDKWLTEVKTFCSSYENMKVVLVANKSDCADEKREVSREEGSAYARLHDMHFLELSATNIDCLSDIDDAMLSLAEGMLAAKERTTFTRSMSNIIRVGGGASSRLDDWVVVDTPDGPVPMSAYNHTTRPYQRPSYSHLRNQLTESVRSVTLRTDKGRCKC